jgi:ABC-type Fe3+ transport system substrate-binding protein
LLPIPAGSQALIEDRLVIITPHPREVTDVTVERFAEYTRQRFGVALRPIIVSQGAPVAYARIIEWRGRPDADLMWAGEPELFDDLAERSLLVPHEIPETQLKEIPAAIGTPRSLPLRDPSGFWVGTALTPAGIIYHPTLLRRRSIEPPHDWDDLLDCRFKGQIVQATPSNSGSNHSSLESLL